MQETNSRQTLCSQLKTVDASLLFLLFIILSVVLSYAAVGIQRRQLADTLAGNTQAAAALLKEGISVRAECEMPENVRARRIYRLLSDGRMEVELHA